MEEGWTVSRKKKRRGAKKERKEDSRLLLSRHERTFAPRPRRRDNGHSTCAGILYSHLAETPWEFSPWTCVHTWLQQWFEYHSFPLLKVSLDILLWRFGIWSLDRSWFFFFFWILFSHCTGLFNNFFFIFDQTFNFDFSYIIFQTELFNYFLKEKILESCETIILRHVSQLENNEML